PATARAARRARAPAAAPPAAGRGERTRSRPGAAPGRTPGRSSTPPARRRTTAGSPSPPSARRGTAAARRAARPAPATANGPVTAPPPSDAELLAHALQHLDPPHHRVAGDEGRRLQVVHQVRRLDQQHLVVVARLQGGDLGGAALDDHVTAAGRVVAVVGD